MSVFEKACADAGLTAWVTELTALVAAAQVRTNLVGDASLAGVQAHVAEALTVAALALEVLGKIPQQVVDIGAGAGLEALTLAKLWPQARVVAVEPRKLRAAFIHETAGALGLGNVETVAKSLFSASLNAEFDVATARAVWPVPQWPDQARGVLRPGGLAMAHVHGPADTLAGRLDVPGWQLVGARDVPGDKGYAVAALRVR